MNANTEDFSLDVVVVGGLVGPDVGPGIVVHTGQWKLSHGHPVGQPD